jgi:hypothetical protein
MRSALMKSARLLSSLLALLAVLVLPLSAAADPAFAPSLLQPKTAAEAWNILRLATENIHTLLGENRLDEVPVQTSLCGPALRAFPGLAREPDLKLETRLRQAFTSLNALTTAAQQGNRDGAQSALEAVQRGLREMEVHFDPKTPAADIFLCPMHADCLADNPKTPCAKCGMDMLKRRIPASFIYTKPGEPTVRMTLEASSPVEAGKPVAVTVRLRTGGTGEKPVTPDDLMVMHTQPIHLLIEEPGLRDYHHEHPAPTATPGEYTFTFTPAKTAPYRVWADLVPFATGIQELPFADLPAAGTGKTAEPESDRFLSETGGYRFELRSPSNLPQPVRAGQTRPMTLTVRDAQGAPVTLMEPVMNAFCHLVGFYSDYQTVLHLHPTGGDVLNPDLRGGPSLGFLLHAPKPGFVRLYAQVRIGGRMLFAPFSLNVVP